MKILKNYEKVNILNKSNASCIPCIIDEFHRITWVTTSYPISNLKILDIEGEGYIAVLPPKAFFFQIINE